MKGIMHHIKTVDKSDHIMSVVRCYMQPISLHYLSVWASMKWACYGLSIMMPILSDVENGSVLPSWIDLKSIQENHNVQNMHLYSFVCCFGVKIRLVFNHWIGVSICSLFSSICSSAISSTLLPCELKHSTVASWLFGQQRAHSNVHNLILKIDSI